MEKKYDYAFIGTSIICILEAIYLSRLGKSVIMIDSENGIGGAWRPIDLFGISGVENAIHYFLDDPIAFSFMRNNLGWNVIESPKKYRILKEPIWGAEAVKYDSILGRTLSSAVIMPKRNDFYKQLLINTKKSILGDLQKSYYVEGGASEILSKTRDLLAKTNIDIKLSTEVIEIKFHQQGVQIQLAGTAVSPYINCSSVYVTHGTRVPKVLDEDKLFNIEKKHHPRPAVHLLVKDASETIFYESIFNEDNLIKYVHDVTRFTKNAKEILGKKKILVFALHKDVKEYKGIYNDLLEKTKNGKILGEEATLLDYKWTDVCLPAIDDSDLARFESSFGSKVCTLKTENFSRAIGLNAERWSSLIKKGL